MDTDADMTDASFGSPASSICHTVVNIPTMGVTI